MGEDIKQSGDPSSVASQDHAQLKYQTLLSAAVDVRAELVLDVATGKHVLPRAQNDLDDLARSLNILCTLIESN